MEPTKTRKQKTKQNKNKAKTKQKKTKRMSNTGTTNKPGVNQGTRHSIDAPETTLDTPRERLKQENRKKTKQLLIL
jgi:hypothetical protein